MQEIPPTALEYSDRSRESRLIVSRDGDGWLFIDPPPKFWRSVGGLFASYLVFGLMGLGLMWGMFSWLMPTFSFVTFLRMMLGGFGDWAFVLEILIITSGTGIAIYAGTKQDLTIRLTRRSVTVTSTTLSLLMKRIPKSLVIQRSELRSVSVARFSPSLILRTYDKKKARYLIRSGRNDALWLTKRIEGELIDVSGNAPMD